MSPFRLNQLIVAIDGGLVYEVIETISRDLSLAGRSLSMASTDYKIKCISNGTVLKASNSMLRKFFRPCFNYNNIWNKING